MLLPMGTFAETSGTYVNLEGLAELRGRRGAFQQARPGWKMLRVLGNLLGLDGFRISVLRGRADEVRRSCRDVVPAPMRASIA